MANSKNSKKDVKKEVKINRDKKVVALKYNSSMDSPKIVAKGTGFMAEKILSQAEEHNIVVYEDKALVEELEKIELGLNIPPYLYEAVAQVLLFVGELDKNLNYQRNGK
ncbi:MAG: EscU/YscU/HrcU family type III secretion system export apparatus switch protein [bacterium]